MGGFFGVTSKNDCVLDIFFGVDYHSHLGTKKGGMALHSKEKGFQREIHNIENTPFRTKFEDDLYEFEGCVSGIGCISDNDPQPLLVRSHLGTYAITTIGAINKRSDLISGIKYAQEAIEGSVTLLILTEDDAIIAARDKLGRLPVLIGKDEEGYAVSFESFAYQKLGYEKDYELGPGEIVKITPEGYKTLQPAGEDMKICAFLWSYYG